MAKQPHIALPPACAVVTFWNWADLHLRPPTPKTPDYRSDVIVFCRAAGQQ